MCRINGCENKSRSRDLCIMHYNRWRRNGDPNIILQEQHGYSRHPLYDVWKGMVSRCYNENNSQYENWGARGITICDEWMNLSVFVKWAIPLWSPGLQIDRRENDGNYKPSNCRFITCKENIHNQRLLRSTNKSGYRGVCFQDRKWLASITINNKQKYLGLFDTPIEAAHAYDKAVPDNRPRNFS